MIVMPGDHRVNPFTITFANESMTEPRIELDLLITVNVFSTFENPVAGAMRVGGDRKSVV